jgi:hypothetical protein
MEFLSMNHINRNNLVSKDDPVTTPDNETQDQSTASGISRSRTVSVSEAKNRCMTDNSEYPTKDIAERDIKPTVENYLDSHLKSDDAFLRIDIFDCMEKLQNDAISDLDFFNEFLTLSNLLFDEPEFRSQLIEESNDDGTYTFSIAGFCSKTIKDKDIVKLLSSNANEATQLTLDVIKSQLDNKGNESSLNIMTCLNFFNFRFQTEKFTTNNSPEDIYFDAFFNKGGGLFILASNFLNSELTYYLEDNYLPININATRDELPEFLQQYSVAIIAEDSKYLANVNIGDKVLHPQYELLETIPINIAREILLERLGINNSSINATSYCEVTNIGLLYYILTIDPDKISSDIPAWSSTALKKFITSYLEEYESNTNEIISNPNPLLLDRYKEPMEQLFVLSKLFNNVSFETYNFINDDDNDFIQKFEELSQKAMLTSNNEVVNIFVEVLFPAFYSQLNTVLNYDKASESLINYFDKLSEVDKQVLFTDKMNQAFNLLMFYAVSHKEDKPELYTKAMGLYKSYLQSEPIKLLLKNEDFAGLYGDLEGSPDWQVADMHNYIFIKNDMILLRTHNELQNAIDVPETVNWEQALLFNKSGEGFALNQYSIQDLYTEKFPLFKDSYSSASLLSAELSKFIFDVIGGDYKTIFANAMKENSVKTKLVSAEDQEKLSIHFSKYINAETIEDVLSKNIEITSEHLEKIKEVFNLKSSSDTDVAWALLFLSFVFIKASSSAIFGTEDDSPIALRMYASSLMYTAYNLDKNCLAPHFKDWNQRLKGKNQAFSCTSVLSNIMSKYLNTADKEKISELIIPKAWGKSLEALPAGGY